MARTRSPTESFEESPKVAGRRPVAATWTTARSPAGYVPTSVPGNTWPSDMVTLKMVAPATTWLLVTMSPLASNTTPEPRPVFVSMTTTDGLTRPTTLMKSFCSAPAIAGDAGAEADGAALAAGAPDASAPVPHAAKRRDPPSRSARRRGGALLLGIGELASDERDVRVISLPPLVGWIRFVCCNGSIDNDRAETSACLRRQRPFCDSGERPPLVPAGFNWPRSLPEVSAYGGVRELSGRGAALAGDRGRILPTECIGVSLRGRHPRL